MNLHASILHAIVQEPGTSLKRLGNLFNLTDYRLKRVFRHIEEGLKDQVLVHDQERGVWIVPIDPLRCLGMEWVGEADGGYVQCPDAPKFPDLRCYRHSECENPEMTAFERRVHAVAGPMDPTAYFLAQLPLMVVDELLETIRDISPFTLRDQTRKQRFIAMLQSARAFLKWKEATRGLERDHWIPPEFAARHRASSGNPFEFSLKKHFVVLEVPVEATREEVLKAWRKLSRQYHPDTPGGDEERMKLINLAKERIFRIRGWDKQTRTKRHEET